MYFLCLAFLIIIINMYFLIIYYLVDYGSEEEGCVCICMCMHVYVCVSLCVGDFHERAHPHHI